MCGVPSNNSTLFARKKYKLTNIMEQNAKKQYYQQIQKQLLSNNPVTISNTVKELRKTGMEKFIPELTDLMLNTKNKDIKKMLLAAIADEKNPEVIPKLTQAIENKRNHQNLADLVSVCWQNGLDFSPYLQLFTSLAIEENYFVAVEALTVIEQAVPQAEISLQNDCIHQIKNQLKQTQKAKQPLLIELIHILEEHK